MLRAKPLMRLKFWWSRWDSNQRPLRCELDNRQNSKYLPFQKLQPPRDFEGFPVFSHSLPSLIRHVLFFWPRIGHLGFVDKMLIESPTLVVPCTETTPSARSEIIQLSISKITVANNSRLMICA